MNKKMSDFIEKRLCRTLQTWGPPVSVACFGSALIAIGASMETGRSSTGISSIHEHTEAIMTAQWWVIGGLFSASAGMLGIIYSSMKGHINGVQKENEKAVDELRTKHDRELDELKDEIHKRWLRRDVEHADIRREVQYVRETNIRELYEKKLDKDDHKNIDHSNLCVFCRTDEPIERRKRPRE